MSGTLSLAGFAARCAALAAAVDHAQYTGLTKAARLVEAESKALIGTYDAGWPALKPETVARKAGGDTPLLETGKLRGSITHSVGHHEAAVGTNEQVGVYQELGTSRMSGAIAALIGGVKVDSSGRHVPQTEPPKAPAQNDPAGRFGKQSYVPPARTQTASAGTGDVHLDGRKVGKVVERRIVAEHATKNGMGGFDTAAMKTPVGWSGPVFA